MVDGVLPYYSEMLDPISINIETGNGADELPFYVVYIHLHSPHRVIIS